VFAANSASETRPDRSSSSKRVHISGMLAYFAVLRARNFSKAAAASGSSSFKEMVPELSASMLNHNVRKLPT